jgi:HNH endonuclease
MALRPCLDCGKTTNGNRCPTDRTRHERARGTTTQRGLGADHRRQRTQAINRAGNPTHCPRCDKPITATNPITGEHGTPRAHGGTQITEVICLSCNSSLGATIRK